MQGGKDNLISFQKNERNRKITFKTYKENIEFVPSHELILWATSFLDNFSIMLYHKACTLTLYCFIPI